MLEKGSPSLVTSDTNLRRFSVYFRSSKQISAQTRAIFVTDSYEFINILPKFFNVYMVQRVETPIHHTI